MTRTLAQEVFQKRPKLRRMMQETRADPGGLSYFEFKFELLTNCAPDKAKAVWHHFMTGLAPMTGGTERLHGLLDLADAKGWPCTIFAPAQPATIPGVLLADGTRSPSAQAKARAISLVELPDAITYGRSQLLWVGEKLCADIQGDEAKRYPTLWGFDPYVLFGETKPELTMQVLRPTTPSLHLEQAIDLTGAFSQGWGHCVMEFAPKLLAADAIGAIPPDAPILVDDGQPTAHYDMLRHMSGGRRKMIKLPVFQAARVDRLWYATAPEFWPVLRQFGLRFRTDLSSVNPAATAKLLSHAPAPSISSRHKKVFLARNSEVAVRLVNQTQVIERLERDGFVTIYPESLSFEEQLSLVAGAETLVGAAGSQMLLALLFGKPDLNIVMLHSPDLEETPTWTAIAEARGQRVCVVCGRVDRPNPVQPYNESYEVPYQAIRQALTTIGDDA